MKNNSNINELMPYERFLRFGPENLTESELLAIILRTGTHELSAIDLASKILDSGKYPRTGILSLVDITLDELKKIKGIGEVKAVKLKAVAEISLRINRARAEIGFKADSPESVAEYFYEKLRHRKAECVILLSLDTKCKIIGESLISTGSVHMSLIPPREVFLEALRCQAVNIILVHNHPSGDPKPSAADKDATLKIKELSDIMDIPLLDHIIIGDNKYTSFKEKGYI